jgi:predicted negative regulator of RcsB-dependent stress response
MALDLEEQEQVAELKAWWNQYGNLIISALTAGLLVIAGWQGWRWYERSQAGEAAMHYEALAKAAQGGDAKSVRDSAGVLVESYPRSLYAAMGALAAARFLYDHNDAKNAKAQLTWAADNARSEELRDLARLRLATILLDEKGYDEALKLLEAKHAPAFDAQYAALRGDVLVAKNQPNDAKAAYRAALDKSDKDQGNAAFRDSVRMRLDALGG